ncbi:hypothetical protein EDI_295090 [Entamoeba dispar SAW760]|uniref:Uncharacterized protein n=1 Tax=Entamoeba dispar (strain ATCC PRA-260 / SAW760) TaxID=370354 RepID=B0EI88_ENTDS|nr:uncharacterized protein EDI_295090 [Entamoeba dispar SAW760]EDR25736.1 hypothetical protein EDI_295090 [Entamoeba dispar SAW760]|eukprot:EDR25736.1 hypothetical protein EDI_295090 [Entamoeba dispar SAW760]
MKINKYAIFVDNNKEKKDVAEMILYLTKNRVSKNLIRIYDISEEKGILQYIKQEKLECPLLFLWGNLYGNLQFVKEQNENGILRLALLNNPNKKNKKKGEKKNTSEFSFSPLIKEEYDETLSKDQVESKTKLEKTTGIDTSIQSNDIKLTEEKQISLNKNNNVVILKPKINSTNNEQPQQQENQEDQILQLQTCKETDQSKEKIEEMKDQSLQTDCKEKLVNEKDINKESFEQSLIKITESYISDSTEEINPKEIVIIDDYENQQSVLQEDEMIDLNVPQLEALNFGDRWLNACEWVIRNISQSSPERKKRIDEIVLEKQPDDIDYYVIRTNWYWRHQIRIMRFGKEHFYRLDETYHVKESFRYEDVKEIVQTDEEHLVIKFLRNSQPQYLQSKLVHQMIVTLVSHLTQDYTITRIN